MTYASKRKSGGSLTREKFLLKELQIVARLRCDGLDDEQIIAAAVDDNIFQFPTTVEGKSIAKACLARLDALQSDALVELAAHGTPMQVTQVNIYAMMQLYELMRVFMVDEIGQRYLTLNPFFSSMDMNAFMTRYCTQDRQAASWSDATIHRLKGTLHHCLVEGGYLTQGSDELNPIMLDYEVEQALRNLGDSQALAAFDCLEV